ncbi:hypothetical protein PR202_ga11798 [Eleusine coracana subsp. coracana]|uniref:Uncharacterized protein n=1 Tax=Eleusine coracana subsp. coracana TaxID=191504 RepID=A0AAV5C9V8_ELECO|nr:hypothetical protein PR202_ga11798 [Eleusine coracana subsp. coracana]
MEPDEAAPPPATPACSGTPALFSILQRSIGVSGPSCCPRNASRIRELAVEGLNPSLHCSAAAATARTWRRRLSRLRCHRSWCVK